MTTIKATKIKRELGFIYFIDDSGSIYRTSELNKPGKKIKFERVLKCNIQKEPGYTYFVDQYGDICRVRLEKVPLKTNVIKKKLKK